MLLELHIIQNFAPSNLNRDDTGSPKSCEFGGYRRARISSQCLKRAIRTTFKDDALIGDANRATRTKRLLTAVAERLVADGKDPHQAEAVVTATLSALEIGIVARPDAEADLAEAAARKEYFDNQKSQYLLYLSPAEIDRLTDFCRGNFDALAKVAAGDGKGRDAKRAAREAAAGVLTKQAVDALKKSLDGGRAADLALFGRMLADLPERNVDAASQVAHAISTHQVSPDFDYYTAVDDLKPEDTAGADMIGTVEFNSACYYRYANIDLAQLVKNLGGDADLAEATVRAFLVASRDATPTGKQNSFAARNAPSFVMAVVRHHGAWSLANAFVRPVRPSGETGLIDASIQALDRHWGELSAMYGSPAEATIAVCSLGEVPLKHLDGFRVPTFSDLIEKALGAAGPGLRS
jgi:CRISPR system Cascade subunit CasC